MSLVPWILGSFVGAVAWAAMLRLPGPLAQWLCAPYGSPGPISKALALTISLGFLLLVLVGSLLGLAHLIEAGSSPTIDVDARKLRGVLFLASLLGYVLVPLIMRLEGSAGRRSKKKPD
jgi:hypothetical protein